MFDALQLQWPFPPAPSLENAHAASLTQLAPDVILNQCGLLRELGDYQRIFSAHKRRFMLIPEVARPSPITAAIGALNQDITQCEYGNGEMSSSRQAIGPSHAPCAELRDQVQGSAKIDRRYQYLQCDVPTAADQGHEHETKGPGCHPQHISE